MDGISKIPGCGSTCDLEIETELERNHAALQQKDQRRANQKAQTPRKFVDKSRRKKQAIKQTKKEPEWPEGMLHTNKTSFRISGKAGKASHLR